LVADAKVPPLIWGFGGRTSMILPSGLLNKMGPVERTGLIAHELAHLKRYDHWIRWFEFVVLGIYWWNPVAWWARAKVQQAEEECCDAWVLWTFPNNGRQYAQALVDTVDFLAGSSERKPEIATAFNQGNSLKRRIEMIVDAKVYRRLTGKTRGMLVLFALTVAPLSLFGSQSGSTDKSEATRHEKVISSDKDKLAFSDDNCQSAKTRQVEPRNPASDEAAVEFHPIKGDLLVNRELEKFQGVWALESYTNEGVTKSADDVGTTFRGQRLIVNGNHWVERNYGISLDIPFEDNRWPRMQFGVNPRKSPARIDYWPVNRPDGWRKLGIYRLEGDKLTICSRVLVLSGDDVRRPAEFDGKEGSRTGLAVYKRLQRR